MEAAREEVLLELKVRSNERDREMCDEYFQGLDQVLEIFKREIGIFNFPKKVNYRQCNNLRLHYIKMF